MVWEQNKGGRSYTDRYPRLLSHETAAGIITWVFCRFVCLGCVVDFRHTVAERQQGRVQWYFLPTVN